MPVHLVPGLKKEHLLASIYDHLHQELNIHFAGAYRVFLQIKVMNMISNI